MGGKGLIEPNAVCEQNPNLTITQDSEPLTKRFGST